VFERERTVHALDRAAAVIGYIKMYFKEIGCEGVDWINLAQNRYN
jgi:hypothetical protein